MSELSSVIQDLSARIEQRDCRVQMEAIHDAEACLRQIYSSILRVLDTECDNAYFVGELLLRQINGVESAVSDKFHQVIEGGDKTILALVLLRIASDAHLTSVTSYLIRRIMTEPTDRYLCNIVMQLASSGVDDAIEPIITRMKEIIAEPLSPGVSFESNSRKDVLVCMIDAIYRLHSALPSEIMAALSQEGIPIEIQQAIKKVVRDSMSGQ